MYLYLYLYLANSQVPVPVPRYYRLYLTPTLILTITENVENNGTEKIGLVTPTPGL